MATPWVELATTLSAPWECNCYTPVVADDLCRKLDEAKKGADFLEQLYNKQPFSLEQLIKLL